MTGRNCRDHSLYVRERIQCRFISCFWNHLSPSTIFLDASALWSVTIGHLSTFVDLIIIDLKLLWPLKGRENVSECAAIVCFSVEFYLNRGFCMQESSHSRPQSRTSHSHVGTPSRPSIQPYNLPDAVNWLLWQQQRKEGLFSFFFPLNFGNRVAHTDAHVIAMWWCFQLWLEKKRVWLCSQWTATWDDVDSGDWWWRITL